MSNYRRRADDSNHRQPPHRRFSEFGWDSLVAIATGVLAFITALLAWSTRALARETAEDVRSEIRPVLIDASRGTLTVTYHPGDDQGAGEVQVKNVGPGPAVNVHIKGSFAGIGESSWRRLGTVGPNQAGSGTSSTSRASTSRARARGPWSQGSSACTRIWLVGCTGRRSRIGRRGSPCIATPIRRWCCTCRSPRLR